jgi:putative ABC transport system substrate-binding protein
VNTRRKLLLALGAGALASPLAPYAQPKAKVWRVGFLAQRRVDTLDSDPFGGFPRGMRDLGYVEGKNLVIEWRSAEGKVERLPELAAELVKLNVDAIVVAGAPATSAVQKATATIPIIMGSVGDPVGSGFVKSLARPGGNITGLANMSTDLSPKHLEMLLGMAPKLSRAALLLNPENPSGAINLKNLQAVAQKTGVTIFAVEARTLQEIGNAFSTMMREKIGAFIVASDPLFTQHRREIAELAVKNRLPSVGAFREYVEAGSLMSYGYNPSELYRQAATYADKIFKGAKPADLPVEQLMKFELFINGKTAKALGLTIPQSLLIMADKVIE